MSDSKKKLLSVVAPSKLNLTLDILSKRDDGFHEIATILQSIDLADTIVFAAEPTNEFDIELLTTENGCSPSFPLDQTNLICGACRAYNQYVGSTPTFSLKILVNKIIPVGAGLAGGSADAAAALIALNKLSQNNLSESQLMEIAEGIGSDVPFCLMGGTALGLGRGDKLTRLSMDIDFHFVVIKPRQISVSTPWAYQMFDEQKTCLSQPGQCRSESVFRLLQDRHHEEAQGKFGNDFEDIIFDHHNFLRKVKETVIDFGALACHLTGSGPTIYGIFESAAQAEKLAEHVRKLSVEVTASDGLRFETVSFDTWVAKSISYGARVVVAS